MLAGQQGRRDEHRRLGPVLDRLEDGADGDLGLAEADVAAHEAVHRTRLLHVGFDVGDRLELIVGLHERKGGLHLRLPGRVAAECVALDGEPAPVQLDELRRDGAGGRPRPALVRCQSAPPIFERVGDSPPL